MKRTIVAVLGILCLSNGMFGKDFEQMSLKEIHETFLANTHIQDIIEMQLDHSYIMRTTNHYMKDPTKKEVIWGSAYNGKYNKYEVESSPSRHQLYIANYTECKNMGFTTLYPEGSLIGSKVAMYRWLILSESIGHFAAYLGGKSKLKEDDIKDLLGFDLRRKCISLFNLSPYISNIDSIRASFEVMVNNEVCLEYDISSDKKVYYYKSTGYLAAIQNGNTMSCFLDYQQGFSVYVWPMTHFILKDGQPYIEETYLDVDFDVQYSPEHFTKHKMK